MDFIAANHHILEKIFAVCKLQTLLQCRLVCKFWAEEATRILRKRGAMIAFRSQEDCEEFLKGAAIHPISLTFTNFLIDIPCSNGFGAESVLNNKDEVPKVIVDLLETYKDNLTELKFWYQPKIRNEAEEEEDEDVPNEELLDEGGQAQEKSECLVLPHLHSLQLLSNSVHPTNNLLAQRQQQQQNNNAPHLMPSFFSRFSTPTLSSLTVQHLYETDCSLAVISIIQSSKRDLEYLKIPAKLFPIIAHNPSIIFTNLQELDLLGIFHGFSCATNDTLDCIRRCCPHLQKLGIEFSFRATQDRIQGLLETLSKTLIELRCTIQDRNLLARQIVRVEFRFPQMSRLKSLQMRWSNPGLVYYIDNLPNLEELMVDTIWARRVQGNIYPSGQPFIVDGGGGIEYKQLRSLKLTEIVTAEQVQVFSQYFPNLHTLGCSFDSNEALRTVYERMVGLKWLIIERKSNVSEAGGVLGLEEDELGKITENLNKGDTFCKDNGNIPRQFPHLGNLKELETLELCQLGITYCSLLYGVVNLPKLRSLVIQGKAFRVNGERRPINVSAENHAKFCNKSKALIRLLASKLKQLRNLTVWIRHTSERLSPKEELCLREQFPLLDDLSVLNHSLCGI